MPGGQPGEVGGINWEMNDRYSRPVVLAQGPTHGIRGKQMHRHQDVLLPLALVQLLANLLQFAVPRVQ